MASVILGGGGSAKQNIESDKYFVSQLGERKNILYIPIAMSESVYTFSECYSWMKSVFEPMGVDEIDMFIDLKSIDFEIIEKYTSIFIGGGNTFYLLDEIRKSGIEKKLKDFLQKGGIIYGGSAGAIILGKDIGTCAHLDSNDVGITDLSGMQLLNNYSVWCHYNENEDELIKDYIIASGNQVIAIPEASGIAYNFDVLRNIGSESCYIFTVSKDKIEVPV